MNRILVRPVLLAVAALTLLGSSGSALAWDRHYSRHDNRGWYDGRGHRHDYVVRHGHRGYWDNHVWIQID